VLCDIKILDLAKNSAYFGMCADSFYTKQVIAHTFIVKIEETPTFLITESGKRTLDCL